MSEKEELLNFLKVTLEFIECHTAAQSCKTAEARDGVIEGLIYWIDHFPD